MASDTQVVLEKLGFNIGFRSVVTDSRAQFIDHMGDNYWANFLNIDQPLQLVVTADTATINDWLRASMSLPLGEMDTHVDFGHLEATGARKSYVSRTHDSPNQFCLNFANKQDLASALEAAREKGIAIEKDGVSIGATLIKRDAERIFSLAQQVKGFSLGKGRA